MPTSTDPSYISFRRMPGKGELGLSLEEVPEIKGPGAFLRGSPT